MGWIDVAEGGGRRRAFVNAIMNLSVTQHADHFLASCGPVSFQGRTQLHGVIWLCITLVD